MSFHEALAEGDLGTVFVDDIFISTNLSNLSSTDTIGFSIDQSSISLNWQKGKDLSGLMRLGPLSLINPPEIFQLEPLVGWGPYEVYIQYDHSLYGRVRGGLIPLGFGLGGRNLESSLLLPRNQIFSKRVVALRDYGLSYFLESSMGLYTQLMIHNGDSNNDNLDGELYYTANWGWKRDQINTACLPIWGRLNRVQLCFRPQNWGGLI